MPEHGKAPTTDVAAQGTSSQTCELASVCAPVPLAIPALSISLDTAVALLDAVGPLAATLPLGISPAPPFHPPRA